jgi:MFS transporter (putative signal transducer)
MGVRNDHPHCEAAASGSAVRRTISLAAMYVPLSFVSGLAFVAVPAQMRDGGQSLVLIGFQTIVMLPWLAKIVWAPWIERYRLPCRGRQRTATIAVAGVGVSTLMLAALAVSSDPSPAFLLGCLLVAATAVATVDIACDGFTIDVSAAANRGWANTAQVAGAYVGIALSGGLFLMVLPSLGWTATLFGLTGLSVLLSIPFLRMAMAVDRDSIRSHRPNLRSALGSRAVRIGLLLVLACSAGPRLSQSMIVPSLVDHGLSLPVIGLIDGIGGVAVSLLGTLCAAAAVRRLGPLRPLVWALGIQASCLALISLLSQMGSVPPWLVAGPVVLLAGATAFGLVALYAELMAYTSPGQPGVDFTVFQCSDAGLALLAGPTSGAIATRFGYDGCFAIASCATLLAFISVPVLIRNCRSATV